MSGLYWKGWRKGLKICAGVNEVHLMSERCCSLIAISAKLVWERCHNWNPESVNKWQKKWETSLKTPQDYEIPWDTNGEIINNGLETGATQMFTLCVFLKINIKFTICVWFGIFLNICSGDSTLCNLKIYPICHPCMSWHRNSEIELHIRTFLTDLDLDYRLL